MTISRFRILMRSSTQDFLLNQFSFPAHGRTLTLITPETQSRFHMALTSIHPRDANPAFDTAACSAKTFHFLPLPSDANGLNLLSHHLSEETRHEAVKRRLTPQQTEPTRP